VFVTGGGDWLRVRIAACVGSSGRPMGLVGEVTTEAGYVCV
jgi:hypothetical protein